MSQLPPLAVSWQYDLDKQAKPQGVDEYKLKDNAEKQRTLTTPRLVIKPLQAEDTEQLHQALMASINEVGPWFTWARKDLSIQQLQQHVDEAVRTANDMRSNNHLFFLIWDSTQQNILGEIWLKIIDWNMPLVTINYWINTNHVGKGYAQESVAELTKYAFKVLNARRVQAHIASCNTKSISVMKKLGFHHEGTLINHSRNFVTNEVFNSKVFALTELI